YDLRFCLVQPSEIAKPVFLFSLSSLFAGKRGLKGARLAALMMLLTFFWTFPIALQPDFGTLTVYIMGFIVVYIVSGGKLIFLLPGFLFALAGSVWVFIRSPYVLERVLAFLDPSADPTGSGWHILQFKYTLARGGFSGRDWGGAVWSNAYLPLSYSDSTFASLTESVGFAGATPVIIGYCVLAYLCYRLSLLAKGESRRVFIFSVGMLVAAQAFLHMSVNVGLFPPTGITLPMFSYGGSSLISTMFGFGMALSAAKTAGKVKKQ
ncbi:MAG: FtsW/RodA/SpoVE family cell cycle protein, partial [Kiritimatiellaeota bacterium]|nr:FtsW/RodA/SpoVE family cell cycle protein [Kiritimatiellota bacterium]